MGIQQSFDKNIKSLYKSLQFRVDARSPAHVIFFLGRIRNSITKEAKARIRINRLLERSALRVKRCPWADRGDLERSYHDQEWGIPVHDDRTLFEFLILEGAQAGLSWSTILKKREGYREAFDHFDAGKISRYSDKNVMRLLSNPGIIRNRLKINAAISNAKAFLQIQKEFESFDRYIWQFVGHQPIQNRWKTMTDIPAASKESETMSRDLRMRGFKFVGPTICYAFMQAVGMVNDHLTDCFRYGELKHRGR